MKIAVTYDNGNIFQHFGKTENFKVYEVEDNQVVSSEVIGSNGTGHGALAGLLSEQGVDVLICGGIGGGAQAALAEAGVELCSGAEGDVDAAVEAYLNGTLTSAGATCDHHDHEEGHSCGDHCGSHEEEESSCGGSCGTCGGGCGAPTPVTGTAYDYRLRLWKVRMSEKPAVPTTEEPSTMEPSLILPTTAANRSSSSAVWAR